MHFQLLIELDTHIFNVRSVILNNEFSACLSVASIMRLRAAAIRALSQDSMAGSMVSKLAHHNYFLNAFNQKKDNKILKGVSKISSMSKSEAEAMQDISQIQHQYGTADKLLIWLSMTV